MHFPRLRNLEPLYAALAEGIRRREFGIVQSPRLLRLDTSLYAVRKDLKSGESAMAALNFERGFYLVDLRAQGSK
jgi:hypothetical protein